MEELSFPAFKVKMHLKSQDQSQVNKKYFKNYMKSEIKRFSSLILSDDITIHKNKAYFKIFQLSLEKPAAERTEENDLAIAKILIEQNIFPEFKNDLSVVKIFSKNLVIKTYKTGEYLFTPNQKDQNLYKIIKGSVVIKNQQDVIIDSKGKGQFIETIEKFHMIKSHFVQCKDNGYFVMINYNSYEQAMKLYIQSKIIIKMLSKTPLFSNFKRSELAYLIELCYQKMLHSKDCLFKENDANNEELYFIVQGQIVITKIGNEKSREVCYLNDGTILGEQIIFDQQQRTFTASVNSSVAQIIFIPLFKIQQMITHFQLPEDVIRKDDYRSFLDRRKDHYFDKLQEDKNTINAYKELAMPKRELEGKKLQMNKILRSVENISRKVQSQSKVMQKRKKQYVKENTIISTQYPLFCGSDFPEYKHLVKKFQIEQQKSKQQLCKLPNLH